MLYKKHKKIKDKHLLEILLETKQMFLCDEESSIVNPTCGMHSFFSENGYMLGTPL